MSDFLDYDGLQRYHELISKKLPTSAGTAGLVLVSSGENNSPVFKTGELIHPLTNVSGTAAVTTSPYYASRWVGTADGVTSLYTGLMITIKVPVAGNSDRGVVLNVNNLGNHPVCANANSNVSTRYGVNSIITLIYDADMSGSVYINSASASSIQGIWKIADYDSTNIWQLRHNNGNYVTSTALGRYVLCLQKNETTLVPVTAVNNSTATTKTLTTDEFNPFGAILYYSTTTTLAANASIAANALGSQVNLNLGYSFNTGSTLTTDKDVYIVAVPQSNGKAKLASTPISQTLPSTDNGNIYIYLGHASSTTNIELHPVHPVYWYKNSKIQVYTGLIDTDTTYKFTIGSTTNGDSTNGVDLGTLKSETAAVNGETLSLVTTGEKAIWNAKTSNTGTVTGVTVGTGGTNYTPTNGVVTIPAYPTTLPASDVSSWAKQSSKPNYSYSEIGFTVNAANNSSTTLSLNGTTPMHVITTTVDITAITLSPNPSEGHSCHVIIAAATEKSVSIAHDPTNSICPGGEDPEPLTIPAGGYIELDFLTANSKVYVRGI